MSDDKDLGKLGAVLAVANQINRDMLDMLKSQQEMMQSQHEELKNNYYEMRTLLERQQKRQAGIIAMAIVGVVAVVVCSCVTFTRLADRIDNGLEGLRHEYTTAENRFAAQQCCCETNRNIDAVRHEAAQNTCAITTNDTANTQKILDRLCAMEANAKDAEIARLRSDLQAAQLTLAQGAQTQTIVGALKAPAPVPAYVVANPYCNCNNGYAYNYNGTVIA